MKIKSKVLSFTLTLAMLITVFMPSMAASSKQGEKNAGDAYTKKVGVKKLAGKSKPGSKIVKKAKGKTTKSNRKNPAKPTGRETMVKITFDAGGGNGEMKEEEVEKNSEYELPECEFEPPSEAKEFSEWEVRIGKAAPKLYKKDDTIIASDNVKCKAIWKNRPVARFDKNGGSTEMEDEFSSLDEEYEVPRCSIKPPAGKVFSKWHVEMDGYHKDIKPGETISVIADMNFKPIWEETPFDVYKISYLPGGAGGNMNPEYVAMNSNFVIPEPEFEQEGGTGLRGYKVKVGSNDLGLKRVGDIIRITDDTTLEAVFEDMYMIHIDPNAPDENEDTDECLPGDNYVLPKPKFDAPSGKVFDYWEVKTDENAPTGESKQPFDKVKCDSDLFIKAIWKNAPSTKFNIKFNKNGGTGTMESKKVPKDSWFEIPHSEFEAPDRKSFKHWQVTVGNAAPETYEDTSGDWIHVKGDVEFKAIYEDIPVVQYDPNEGTGSIPDEWVEEGNEYTLPSTCKITPPAGMVFDKWQIRMNGFIKDFNPGAKFTVTHDVIVKPLWKVDPAPGKVTVSFDKNGGSGNMNSVEVNKYSEYKLPACTFTAPEGMEFDKWSVKIGDDPAEDKNPGEKVTASDNIKVTAMWRAKPKVNVTFDKNGGSGNMPAKAVVKDSEYTLPVCRFTAPADKEFDKWSVTVTGFPAVDKMPGESIVAGGDVSVTAMWKAKTVPPVPPVPVPDKANITFNKNGGNGNMDLIQVEKGSNYTLPVCSFTAPTDKEFDKWSVIIGSATAVDKQPGEGIVASDNVAVTALWKEKAAPPVPPAPDKVKITFKPNGGTQTMPEVEVNRDSEYTLPECGFTAPAGKEFDKWQLEMNGFTKFANKGEGFKVLYDTVVMPIWKDKEVTEVNVKYDANGGSGEMPQETAKKNAKFTVPACEYAAPSNSIFKHWEVTVGQESAVNKVPGEKVVVKEDITLKAVWEKQINVSFNNGGEEITGVLPSGIMTSSGKTVYLPLPEFKAKNENKLFVAWEDPNHKQYKPGATFVVDSDVEFTAVWKDKAPEVKYAAMKFTYNGNSIGMKTRKYVVGSNVAMPKFTGAIPQGQGAFSHWKVVNDTDTIEKLEVGDVFTIKGDAVATPVFKEKEIPKKVTLKINVGKKPLTIKNNAKTAKLKLKITGAGIADLKLLNATLMKGKTKITDVSLKNIKKNGVLEIVLNKKMINKIKGKKAKKLNLTFTIFEGQKTKGASAVIKVQFKK